MNDETKHKHRRYFVLALLAVFLAILAIALPELETGQAIYINATTINMSGFASYTGCTIANISEINHGNCSAVEDTSPWVVTVNFTNVTNFSYVEVKQLYYSTVGASTHTNDIEIFCHTEMAYVDLELFSNEKEWFYYSRNIADSMHFIDAQGNVSIRLNHSENGNTNHRLLIDVIRLIQKPTFEQNIVSLTQIFNTTTTGGGGGVSNLSNLTIDSNKDWMNYSIYNASINHYNLTNKTLSDHSVTSALDMNNYNITNIRNLFLNTAFYGTKVIQLSASPFNYYTNASNIPAYFVSEDRNNAKVFQDVYQGTAAGLQNGGGTTVRVARGNSTAGFLNLTGSDRLFQFTGQGYKNGSFRTQFSMSADLEPTEKQSNTSSPTTIRFQVTRENAVTSTNSFAFNATGAFEIMNPGMGFTIMSNNGTRWCLNMTDAGVLQLTLGYCQQI